MPSPLPPLHVEPFTVEVGDAVLTDLRARIRNTRWPEPAPGPAWSQGADRDYLQQLLAYWADGFDWRGIRPRHPVAAGLRLLAAAAPHRRQLPLRRRPLAPAHELQVDTLR